MLTFRDLFTALRKLDLDRARPVIAHGSLSSFGEVNGGADTILGALLSISNSVIMPTFTFKTMLIPEVGPQHNAIQYGSGKDLNRMAEFFTPDMPVDPLMGTIPEALRLHPKAHRSMHPILSFAGINTTPELDKQTINEPLAPLHALREGGGWVILLGVDHTVNTSIHYGELLAGRKQFVRWALTPDGVIECPGFSGCSNGFNAITPSLDQVIRRVQVGNSLVQALPIAALVETVLAMLKQDPLALLCEKPDCERCNAVRESVQK
jgi:aminoglycoside 3-N-acetyltransferase